MRLATREYVDDNLLRLKEERDRCLADYASLQEEYLEYRKVPTIPPTGSPSISSLPLPSVSRQPPKTIQGESVRFHIDDDRGEVVVECEDFSERTEIVSLRLNVVLVGGIPFNNNPSNCYSAIRFVGKGMAVFDSNQAQGSPASSSFFCNGETHPITLDKQLPLLLEEGRLRIQVPFVGEDWFLCDGRYEKTSDRIVDVRSGDCSSDFFKCNEVKYYI